MSPHSAIRLSNMDSTGFLATSHSGAYWLVSRNVTEKSVLSLAVGGECREGIVPQSRSVRQQLLDSYAPYLFICEYLD